ncbi:ligase-associated DNA damage response endonuclease PdeM [Sphingomonas changnyeongensis]|uniref:Ligase-associated DNA damage response endonuclease PdeM n=1 Tax=Sphingomonas changnyeongensis TaxID=2698679 RepID=A0A7Z2NTS0_9SPHN|nr:ligase-associated DNA damage response endonuclease PdeM [Sphingomonas changnyeongensis]QHL89706.1 ligase-associated DNA damage response endonuclease PdeM [Sphingomonas changnyeongensis]
MVRFSFAGHELAALAEGALFWPARQALLVADLHLEKASWFARTGQMLPPYDSQATLEALAALAGQTGAREIWCLGDSFHDADGSARLPDAARALIDRLAASARLFWITGNHDPAPSGSRPLPGQLLDEAVVDGLVLRHEADPADPRPELSGHFHPKLRVRVRGRQVARRCFVRSPAKLILPAFGALTGGLDAGHPEIRRAAGEGAEALVALSNRLLRFPIAA